MSKYTILTTGLFQKDLKLIKKRQFKLAKLEAIITTLASGNELDIRTRPHKLSGNWANHWECHIEPDWLLIWRYDGDDLILVRTGTHSDLF